MKKKRRGFTLIELLAVILILAVIALIAIPVITGIIDEAKKGAAVDSTYNYLNELTIYMQLQDINNYDDKLENGKVYKVDKETIFDITDVIGDLYLKDIIKMKGTIPLDGYIKMEDNGISYAILEMDRYIVECTSTDKCVVLGKYQLVEATGVSVSSVDGKNLFGINQTLQLSTTIEPSNTTDKKITWSSSDENIATVDNKGLVTGISNGEVTITATTKNGVKSSYVVIVSPFYEDNKVYIYKSGQINTLEIEGITFSPENGGDFIMTLGSEYITMQFNRSNAASRATITSSKIDLTDYKSVSIEYDAPREIDNIYNYITFGIRTEQSGNFVKSVNEKYTKSTPFVKTLDISEITGEHYIAAVTPSLNPVHIYKIWLEK